MDNRVLGNVKTGILIAFIVVPVILILLLVFLFTISMDSIIASLTNSFSDFISQINVFFWGGQLCFLIKLLMVIKKMSVTRQPIMHLLDIGNDPFRGL